MHGCYIVIYFLPSRFPRSRLSFPFIHPFPKWRCDENIWWKEGLKKQKLLSVSGFADYPVDFFSFPFGFPHFISFQLFFRSELLRLVVDFFIKQRITGAVCKGE